MNKPTKVIMIVVLVLGVLGLLILSYWEGYTDGYIHGTSQYKEIVNGLCKNYNLLTDLFNNLAKTVGGITKLDTLDCMVN